MNIFKNLILALLISAGFTDAFAMEEGITKEAPTTGPDFPVDIWGEIVKQIINDKELSLEQKAKKLEDLRFTSNYSRIAIDKLIAQSPSNDPIINILKEREKFKTSTRDIMNRKKEKGPSLPLHLSNLLQLKSYVAAKQFLKDLSANEKQKAIDFALYLECSSLAKPKSIKFLLEEGANPNLSSPDRDLPLTHLIRNTNIEALEELLKNGANPDIKDPNNNNLSPLEYAKKLATLPKYKSEQLDKIIALMEKHSSWLERLKQNFSGIKNIFKFINNSPKV